MASGGAAQPWGDTIVIPDLSPDPDPADLVEAAMAAEPAPNPESPPPAAAAPATEETAAPVTAHAEQAPEAASAPSAPEEAVPSAPAAAESAAEGATSPPARDEAGSSAPAAEPAADEAATAPSPPAAPAAEPTPATAPAAESPPELEKTSAPAAVIADKTASSLPPPSKPSPSPPAATEDRAEAGNGRDAAKDAATTDGPPAKRARKDADADLKELLIQRVLRQRREIANIERRIEETKSRGGGGGGGGAIDERLAAYDAILQAHSDETEALRERRSEEHRARVEGRDFTSVPLDTAGCLRLLQLKRRIRDAEARAAEARKKALAIPCGPGSAGRLVVGRERALRQENIELEQQAVTGRHGQLRCEIALYQRHNAELKAALQRLEARSEDLDEEITDKQRRIVELRAGAEKKKVPVWLRT